MKKLLVFALLWTAFLGYTARLSAQSGYGVDLVVDDHWWQSTENYGVSFRAVISYNGNSIPNSNDYYYWLGFIFPRMAIGGHSHQTLGKTR